MKKLTPEEREIARQRNKERRHEWLLMKMQNDPEWYERNKAYSKERQKLRRQIDPNYKASRNTQRRKWYADNTLKMRFKGGISYCKDDKFELIENYDKAKADNFKGWDIHHRDEIRTLPSGITVYRSRDELIESDRYYNCPPNELIFLTKSEHAKLHSYTRH